MERISLDHY